MTNVNFVDQRLRDLEIPSDILDRIYIGRCEGYGPKKWWACSRHLGEITDVNFWSKAKTVTEMIKWTNCKYVQM